MPELLIYIALTVGALALVLSIVALLAIRRVRREQAKPRLSSKLSWLEMEGLPTGTIRLDIWNAGSLPLTIKKVRLVWEDAHNDKRGTGSMGFALYDPHAKSLLGSTSDDSLQPCEGTTFILPPLPPAMMRKPAEMPEDKVWISIEGGSGELARIEGKILKPVLENYLPSPQPCDRSKV